MGVRGELFSSRVILPNRTYFFNVKENRMGDLYLNIVESKNRDNGGFERQSVILFADDLQEFLKGFDESLKVMEKAVREKRRPDGESPKREREPREHDGRDDKEVRRKPRKDFSGEKPSGNRAPRGGRPRGDGARSGGGRGRSPHGGARSEGARGGKPHGAKRMVVKKHNRPE